MVDFVSALNPNTPNYNDPVSEAAAQVRGIKQALKGTFPLFVDALNIGPTEIGTIEDRIVALELAFSVGARKIDSGSIDMDDSLGVYTVSGLSFTPSLIIFSGNSTGTVVVIPSANASYGFTDGVQQHSMAYASDGENRAGNDTALGTSAFLWRLYGAQASGGPPNELTHQGVISSINPDGFSVEMTKAFPATFSNRFLWTAFE